MEFTYKFPVVRGRQAGREYYIAMVPLKMLGKLFPREEEYVQPEYRAQRRLNISRVPVIKRYILDNEDAYVFSALAASIDGEFIFKSIGSPDTGILEVTMAAKFLINDGQHRKAAILEALDERPALGDETIPVVFFEDKGLARSQQMFTDLNKHAVKTSNSISELYDSRDELAVITRNVIADNDFLNKYTDKEKDILGKFSSSLFTLNTFYNANKKILRKHELNNDAEAFLKKYWKYVVQYIAPWNDLVSREISKLDLRENYIVTQAVFIQALGYLGNYFFENPQVSTEECLTGLSKIDWSRSSKNWALRIIRGNGKIINSEEAAALTCIVIKQQLRIKLGIEEQNKEKIFLGKN